MYQIYPKSGNAICSIVSIFFSLKVAHMRIANNFKGHYIENLPKLNYANISVFLKLQILMPQILRGLQLCTW